ncbi:ABC transporter permease [Streptomyces mangrovisoli]|uniref:ABC transporter permease n=1 Tax=Streptomyces mangrovisoli TaxID=1428628 RepID=A0A1J4NWU5_9ACTN|nr:ABC transporter permease [Streptomyces mangrovisoli]
MQTTVVALATLLSVTASVLAGALLVASDKPFDTAFARQHGAHLTAQFDARRVTAARLAASAHTTGVAAAAGPYPTVSAAPGTPDGGEAAPLALVGRASRGGAVDRVTLTQGRWVRTTGEVVIAAGSDTPTRLGDRLSFPDLPGSPTLTVVGVARSVSRTADGWVTPAEITALSASGHPAGYQMLYRLTEAGTAAQVAAGRSAVEAAVPAKSLQTARSWLAVKKAANRDTALFVPFLVTFGVLGLMMSALVAGSMVAGTVATGLRRIGVLKAVGCTPGQVVRAHAAQALVPALAATALGVAAGHLLAVPLLSDTADAYGTVGLGVAVRVDVVVVAAVLAVVAGAACASAWRAGRLRTVDALAVGRSAGTARGRRATALAARLPVPPGLALGLARPFARPGRTAAMVVAIAFGAAAVTFATGLSSSLGAVIAAKNHNAADVTVGLSAPGGTRAEPGQRPPTADDATRIKTAIAAQSGTRAQYGSASERAGVTGVTGEVPVVAFDGDASWGGFRMVSGRWLHGAGEAVAATPFLAAAGARVGDTVTLTVHGTQVPVRIVGEVFDTGEDGMHVFTDIRTLTHADPGLTVSAHYVDVAPGTDVAMYVKALDARLKPLGISATSDKFVNGSDVADALDSVTALLSVMLAAVAALGVLGGVVLDTRERVRDLGVHKALGMTPRQTVAMVVASVVVPGLVGGALGVPLGYALHALVMPAMGRAAGLRLPHYVVDVYHLPGLLLLGLTGAAVAVVGALLPAGWAARVRTATALRTE